MRRISRIERRSLVTGWIKWALLPAIPFSVFFFDAWLNIQVRHKDYELSQLNEVRRQLNEELDTVHAKEARLSGVEHLTEMASQLDLLPPSPQQFRSVSFPETSRRIPVMSLASAPDPPAPPIRINLEEAAPVALARNIPAVSAETPAAVSTVALDTEEMPLHDDASKNFSAPAGLQSLEDTELGVEEMLGKL